MRIVQNITFKNVLLPINFNSLNYGKFRLEKSAIRLY